MEQLKLFSSFFERVEIDQRIGTAHVSVYMALLQLWIRVEFCELLTVSRQEVMSLARIQGRATYNKCMKELELYGYIKYTPSFNPVVRCEVKLLDLDNTKAMIKDLSLRTIKKVS